MQKVVYSLGSCHVRSITAPMPAAHIKKGKKKLNSLTTKFPSTHTGNAVPAPTQSSPSLIHKEHTILHQYSPQETLERFGITYQTTSRLREGVRKATTRARILKAELASECRTQQNWRSSRVTITENGRRPLMKNKTVTKQRFYNAL